MKTAAAACSDAIVLRLTEQAFRVIHPNQIFITARVLLNLEYWQSSEAIRALPLPTIPNGYYVLFQKSHCDYSRAECVCNQSRRAAFIRVCQPLPVALNAATTSAS
nr:hypothetical protein [Stenoxybacter acetivorans]